MSNSLDFNNRMGRAANSVKEAAKSPTMPAGSPFIEWFFRPAMLLRMSLVVGVFALWPYVAQRLPSLGNRPEYRLTFDQIQISPAPQSPVPGNLIEQVIELTKFPRELSLLDEKLTSDLAAAFRQHPWISNVISVRKSFPARITIELEYRQPVAMVEVSGGRVPIDVKAVVLPSADFSTSDGRRFPLIQNANSKPATRPGMIWNDPALIAAARLAKLLDEKWKPLKLEAISIPRDASSKSNVNDIPLELIGKGGSRIAWGRPPGSDHPGELEPTQKIRRLEKYLADFGDYDKPNGPYEIDIRHWQEISRHPLVNDQARSKSPKTPKQEARNSETKKKSRN